MKKEYGYQDLVKFIVENELGSMEDLEGMELEDFGDVMDWFGVRVCSHCGEFMVEGYCIFTSTLEYYCSDTCLLENMTQDEYDELYEYGDSYWTEW